MDKNKQLIALGVGILFIAGIVIFGNMSGAGTENTNTTITIEDRVKGNKNAVVKLVEYSDFQCPACGAYYPIVKQLMDEYGDKVKFTYKHFPLRRIHANADLAARAAEAAGVQGKFWEMHDMIFENQEKWSEARAQSIFVGYAKDLGLGADKFKKDLSSKEVKAKVQNDFEEGIALGVNSTPSFFLNGEKLSGIKSYEEFKNIIENAINSDVSEN